MGADCYIAALDNSPGINSGEAKAVGGFSDSSSQVRWSLSGSRTAGRLKERFHILLMGQVWENKGHVAIYAP